MRLVIITLVLFISRQYFAGCGNVVCSTSNGIYAVSGSPAGYITNTKIYITSEDSIEITCSRVGNCSASVLRITIDGLGQSFSQIKKTFSGEHNRIKILGKAGKYIVSTDQGDVDFEFLMKSVESTCGPLLCNTSNGLNVTPTGQYLGTKDIDTVYVSKVDSMTVTLRGPQCGVSAPTISINGTHQSYATPFCGYCWESHTLRMLANPGYYEVEALVHGYPYKVYFTIILNPVGIIENQNAEAYLQVFPNPAHDFITIRSGQESLKSISFKNYLGQEIKNVEVHSDNLEFPIGDLAAGIYFLHVATPSNNLSIRKIVIE